MSWGLRLGEYYLCRLAKVKPDHRDEPSLEDSKCGNEERWDPVRGIICPEYSVDACLYPINRSSFDHCSRDRTGVHAQNSRRSANDDTMDDSRDMEPFVVYRRTEFFFTLFRLPTSADETIGNIILQLRFISQRPESVSGDFPAWMVRSANQRRTGISTLVQS